MKYKGRLVVKGKRVSKNEKLKKSIERKVKNKYGSHEIYSLYCGAHRTQLQRLYEVCPQGIEHVVWKIETFIEEDTRYKKHCT